MDVNCVHVHVHFVLFWPESGVQKVAGYKEASMRCDSMRISRTGDCK